MAALVIRPIVQAADRARVRAIVTATDMFHAPEVDVAVELVDDKLAKGDASDYHFFFADEGDATLGYACYGYNEMTQSSWELYWIAVDPNCQGKGVGRALLDAVEADIRARGGSRIYVETGGRAEYTPTRAFYCARRYVIGAELPDFYAPGDAKVIFVKAL
jgi:GNAT superfamily N-acetyltransferase